MAGDVPICTARGCGRWSFHTTTTCLQWIWTGDSSAIRCQVSTAPSNLGARRQQLLPRMTKYPQHCYLRRKFAPLRAFIRYSSPFLNVGLMFVRSGGPTTVLAEQVMQRTLHAWEQGVFNEELNWGVGANLSCCHAPHGHSFDPLLKHFRKDASTHAQKEIVAKKQPDEFKAGCDTLQPSVSPFHWEAPLPPTTSPLQWQQVHGRTQENSTTGWSKHRFNALVQRGLGRCTELHNVCERGQRTESPASPTAPPAAPRAAPPTAPPAASLLLPATTP